MSIHELVREAFPNAEDQAAARRLLHVPERDFTAIDELPTFQPISTMERPRDEPYLIDGVMKHNTLAMLAASDGVGKSHLRRQVGLHLALGPDAGPLFGHYAVREKCTVLVVDEENGEEEEWAGEDLILAGLHRRREEAVHYRRLSYAGINLIDERWQRHLSACVEQARQDIPGQPVVLMLDHISLMVGKEWGEEMKEATRLLLAQIRDRPWLTILVIAHMVKPMRDGKPQNPVRDLQDVLGNLPRSMSSVAVVSDLGEDRVRWEMRKRVPRSAIILARGSGIWNYVGETSKVASTGKVSADEMLAYVRERADVTAKQAGEHFSALGEAKKISKDQAARVLNDLVGVGEVDRRVGDRGTFYYMAVASTD